MINEAGNFTWKVVVGQIQFVECLSFLVISIDFYEDQHCQVKRISSCMEIIKSFKSWSKSSSNAVPLFVRSHAFIEKIE